MPSDSVMLVGAFIPIAAILVGGLILLVPIAGLTLRFALKPLLEGLSQMRDLRGQAQEIRLLEQRLALVEEQLHSLPLSSGRNGSALAEASAPAEPFALGSGTGPDSATRHA